MKNLFLNFRVFVSKVLEGIDLKNIILFGGIILLGIFARVWEFGKLPSGLIADEASIGVDAYSLLHYGVDHNGISFPIHFISFGSGQNALYGYLLIPFIALFGLKMVTIKLPMLISGILTMPLMYWVSQRTFNNRIALISMFFLAISPWHIMLSRFGLESNLLPFVFLLGYACLLNSLSNEKWFPFACVVFGICLYSYVTAYLTIPFFLICMLVIIIGKRQIRPKYVAIGLACFLFTTVPIGLFIIINIFNLSTLKIGPITIPHLPTQPRFESESGALTTQLFQSLFLNSWNLLKLLVNQSDGIIYNTLDPYGYFYRITFPFAIFGLILLIRSHKSGNGNEKYLLLSWFAAPLLLGILQPVNINRINIIFIPILMFMAVAIDWLGARYKPFMLIAICSFLIAFIAFISDYHGERNRLITEFKFHTGLLAAIQYSINESNGPICMTDKIDMPYIYTLFVEKPDPASYLTTIRYKANSGPFRQVESILRYNFGRESCPDIPGTIYILKSDDGLPRTGTRYNVEFFNDFRVFTPKP